MHVRPFTLIKLLVLVIVIAYASLIPSSSYLNKVDAFFVLTLSLFLVIKSRNNIPLFVMFIFILYVNYSIIIAEYFVGGELSVPFTAVKTDEIYGLTIRIMFLFMSILALFYNNRGFDLSKDNIKTKDNWIVFYITVLALIFSLIVGVDRGDFQSYSVRTSPIFEYSKLLFLFAFFYSGKSMFRKGILIILVGIFILQDAFYGGRVTSLQLIIFLSVTLFINKLSVKKIIGCSFVGIILMSIIGFYRSSYEFIDFNIVSLIKGLLNNYFVFDTATYAYYASATHVAATEITEITVRLKSLIDFAISIVTGTNGTSDVTIFVREIGFFNMGGGIIPTHFYFWFGWFGVILIGFLIVFLINNLNYNSRYQNLLFLGIIINIPRWYLYSPNQLFRGVLFFITVLFIGLWVIKELSRRKSI